MVENKADLIPTYDKSRWGQGEWDNEPDRVDFIHSGYSCFILRNRTGNWCGYVGIPSTHPYYGNKYSDVDVDVHGGITYASKCSPPICHIPESGMPENVWWLGFDTAHAWDVTPARLDQLFQDATYKNMNYTIKETKFLAEKLKTIEQNRS